MTTALQTDLVVEHLQAWAAGFREGAQLNRQAIKDGDPAGIGIAKLVGRYEGYRECAEALQVAADRLRSDERPVKLEVVS